MKLNKNLINDENGYWTAEDFRLPETLGNPDDTAQMANDACFNTIAGMLDHSLSGLMSEGMQKFVGYGVLTGLAQNGMIRAGVETRADEMTRKWGMFKGSDDSDKLAELEKETDKFKIMNILNRAAALCGYYGGCLGFIDTGESESSWVNPLILSKDTFKKDSFKGIKLIEPYLVTPASYNAVNPMAEDYYKPQVWYVQGIPVHWTRMLYFAENELPTLIKPAYNFFGLSLAQKVLDAVSHYTNLRESAAALMEKYALTVFKTDMSEILAGGMDNTLAMRVKYFIQMRNNDGCAAIDKDKEDLVVQTTSLGGVTDLVRQAQEYVAAMFCEPVTKMWGLSPAGFNSGDSDLRNHYDNIAALQQKILYDPMQKVAKILQLNKYGEVDPDITFDFNPLSDEDENMKISTAQAKCTINTSYMEAGVLSAEEVRKALIDDPDSGFEGLDPEPPKQQGGGEDLTPFDENEDLETGEPMTEEQPTAGEKPAENTQNVSDLEKKSPNDNENGEKEEKLPNGE